MSRGGGSAAVPAVAADDLAGYPLVLTKAHMARIFGRSVRWVDQHVAAGTFPIPRLTRMSSAAWRKADVQQFFTQRTFAPLRRST